MKNKLFILLWVQGSLFSYIHSSNVIVHRSRQGITTTVKNVYNLYYYFLLLDQGLDQYLKPEKREPKIQCKKCMDKIATFSEFGGSLLGMTLKDLSNFNGMKPFLDKVVKVLVEGSFAELEDCMIFVANKIEQPCVGCREPSSSWGKL